MAQLIDKYTLVAEIKKRKIIARENAEIASNNNNVPVAALWSGKENICNELLSFLDTLEVKDVDLEKTLNGFQNFYAHENSGEFPSAIEIARHFYELGLKANQENNVIGILERAVKIDAGGYPYIDCSIELYDYDKDIPLAKEGDKVKIVVIKGE